jgi:hypothetical protein
MTDFQFSDDDLKRSQLEFRLQVAVVDHIAKCFSVWFTAFPGRPGDAKDGFMKKKMGVKAGVPDILVILKGGILGAIELKIKGGVQNKAQHEEPCYMAAQGAKVGLCTSVRQVHDLLVSWGCKAKYDSVQEPDLRSDGQKKQDMYDMYRR